ncbi:MAG: hypothetical protein LRY35_01345 [Clostridiales bacterium]|nr:hypothetical protein [Clostridiales bacterium]
MKHFARQKWLIGVISLALAGTLVWNLFNPITANAETTTQSATKEVIAERGNVTAGVTESGTVSIGTQTQTFGLDLSSDTDSSASGLSASLEVLSLDASIGQILKVGDPLLTLTEDSLATVRKYLEEAVQTAQSNLTAATIERDKDKLEATYTYKANQALGTTAQATHDTTIAQLNIDVADAEREIADANERITEIPAEITELEDEIDDLDDDDDSARIYSLKQEIEDLTDERSDLIDSLPTLEMKKDQSRTRAAIWHHLCQATLESQLVLYKKRPFYLPGCTQRHQ